MGQIDHLVPTSGLPHAFQIGQIPGKEIRPHVLETGGNGTPDRIKALPQEFGQELLLGTTEVLTEDGLEICERGGLLA